MDATFSKENRAELKVFRISLSLILLLGGGKAIHHALLRAELPQKGRGRPVHLLPPARGGGSARRRAREGVAGESGWWGDRPPARLLAAGVVEGGSGLRIQGGGSGGGGLHGHRT